VNFEFKGPFAIGWNIWQDWHTQPIDIFVSSALSALQIIAH